ncbi:MAG: hypothetical protein DWH99_10295 [Planctomycetota bacterium]|nr:MAG: hypothetical protein DWH99_10295 [Planctomycetota bacterium]
MVDVERFTILIKSGFIQRLDKLSTPARMVVLMTALAITGLSLEQLLSSETNVAKFTWLISSLVGWVTVLTLLLHRWNKAGAVERKILFLLTIIVIAPNLLALLVIGFLCFL